jgi:hypothetical protein
MTFLIYVILYLITIILLAFGFIFSRIKPTKIFNTDTAHFWKCFSSIIIIVYIWAIFFCRLFGGV